MSEVFKEIHNLGEDVAKITVNRDLRKLVDLGFLTMNGAGPASAYEISKKALFSKEIDVEKYFSVDPDKRDIKRYFNFNIFDEIEEVFTKSELDFLNDLNATYLSKMKKLPQEILKKEFERLTTELSWKSSKIEGNTYSLLETERLLKEHLEAKGHLHSEAVMILNHKKTLDYLRENIDKFKKMSVKQIVEIHSLLVEDLDVTKNIRKILVRITGTAYTPPDNDFQIKEALERTVDLINKKKNPFEKALILMLLVAYIQPFTDGNKRTSRLTGNAILLAHNCCPLSYRSVDEFEYKKAVLLFYEQNNFSYFKKLFIEQYEFAVQNYF